MSKKSLILVTLAAVGCSIPVADAGEFDGGGSTGAGGADSADGQTGGTAGETHSPTSGDGTADSDDSDDSDTDSGGVGFDLGVRDDGGFDACAVQELDGPPPECSDVAPPETFDTPTLEWAFGEQLDQQGRTWATPLVGNLTDDNDDGVIDLCDTPDVVLVSETALWVCSMFIVDGATGTLHTEIPDIHCDITPAIGDLDQDGEMEIVTMREDASVAYLVAYAPDGTKLWEDTSTGYGSYPFGWSGTGIALHDLNGDGSPEIILEDSIHDADGNLMWMNPLFMGTGYLMLGSPFAADLDGDGDQDYINGGGIYEVVTEDDGSWSIAEDGMTYVLPNPTEVALLPPPRIASVADLLPGHEGPEVFFATSQGWFLWAADGSFPWGEAYVFPEGVQDCDLSSPTHWGRPPAIADYDGDGEAEVAVSACSTFMIVEITETGPEIAWTAPVHDESGSSSSTSFDFLGDGTPEPIYSDESTAWIWTRSDDDWEPRMELSRASGTIIEYPVVADVDNDGSAEILVVSFDGSQPALQVFGTAENNWVQPRRIWNQHAYMVTNVREDGTIPAQPVPNWEVLNTFRSNSPIGDGGICVPAG